MGGNHYFLTNLLSPEETNIICGMPHCWGNQYGDVGLDIGLLRQKSESEHYCQEKLSGCVLIKAILAPNIISATYFLRRPPRSLDFSGAILCCAFRFARERILSYPQVCFSCRIIFLPCLFFCQDMMNGQAPCFTSPFVLQSRQDIMLVFKVKLS